MKQEDTWKLNLIMELLRWVFSTKVVLFLLLTREQQEVNLLVSFKYKLLWPELNLM